MNPHEIKVDHCYSLKPINGRRTIARVTNLFRITAMAAYEEAGTETLELNPVVVRFVWRHAAYPTGWSTRRQRLLLEDFVLAAEEEVTGI
jgi:undecaprenyl pyrophosphate synthase